MGKDRSIVGDLINFRGLVYAPINENGVIFLFGRVADDLHMYIEEIKPGFPDCVARRYTGKGWERVLIEFEYQSSNFQVHKHDVKGCDIIVCWEHDWKACPIEVIELKTAIQEMENRPVKKPTTNGMGNLTEDQALEKLFNEQKVPAQVQGWYRSIISELQQWNPEIWVNVGRIYIGVYSPEKSFASVKLSPTMVSIECFTRGEKLEGTRVVSPKFSPKWAKFSVKGNDQVTGAVDVLKESHRRLKAAIQAGEPTCYFATGQIPIPESDIEEESDNSLLATDHS